MLAGQPGLLGKPPLSQVPWLTSTVAGCSLRHGQLICSPMDHIGAQDWLETRFSLLLSLLCPFCAFSGYHLALRKAVNFRTRRQLKPTPHRMQMKSLRPRKVKTSAQIPVINEQWNQSTWVWLRPGPFFLLFINMKKKPRHAIHFCACSHASLHPSGSKVIISEELRIENDYCLCHLSGLMFECEGMWRVAMDRSAWQHSLVIRVINTGVSGPRSWLHKTVQRAEWVDGNPSPNCQSFSFFQRTWKLDSSVQYLDFFNLNF